MNIEIESSETTHGEYENVPWNLKAQLHANIKA